MTIIAAFDSAGDAAFDRRAEKIRGCCSMPALRMRSDGDTFVSLNRCRDRLCPLCTDRRGKVAAKRVEAAVRRMNAPRFLTLTAPATNAPLADQLRSLRDAFARLRRSQPWKSRVDGGAYAIEITLNVRTGRWHPHLHAIIDGVFFPHAEIKSAWRTALNASTWPVHLEEGDPLIVHIKAITDRRSTAKYISRYISKPEQIDTWPLAAIVEYAEALAGVRMLANFGTLHGVSLDPADPNETGSDSCELIHLPKLDGRARRGCVAATAAIGLVVRLHPECRPMFGACVPSGAPPAENERGSLLAALRKLCRAVNEKLEPILDPAELGPRQRSKPKPPTMWDLVA